MHSASFAVNRSVVQRLTIGPKLRFILTYSLLALAFVSVALPLHAAGPGPRWAYILDPAGLVHVYTVNRASGALVNTACAPMPAGVSPVSIKVDPSRSFAFVADNVGNAIFGFTINQITGCLAPTAQIAIATAPATHPGSLHITASGKFLYVSTTNAGNAAIEGFSIAPVTGVLAPLGPPMNYGLVQAALAYDPVRDFLLAADDSAPVGPIVSFTVGAGGVLAFDAASPTVAPNPRSMTIDPVGGFLLVLSGAAPVVDSYALNPITGALAHVNAAPTGVGPAEVVSTSIGQLAYVTNNGASTVSSYMIGPAGALAKFAGADTALRAPALNPVKATIDDNGEFLYTLDATGHVSIFKVAAGKAAEIAAVSSPFVLTYLNPSGIAITQ